MIDYMFENKLGEGESDKERKTERDRGTEMVRETGGVGEEES